MFKHSILKILKFENFSKSKNVMFVLKFKVINLKLRMILKLDGKKKLVEVVNRQIVIFGGHLLFD